MSGNSSVDRDFKWLHLTDLHVGMQDQDWLWPKFKNELFNDLTQLHSITGDWDLVIFSGDLTQRGTREEFDRLDEILADIWKQFKRLRFSPSLFVIPGNHDVQRPVLNATYRTLKRWWEEPEIHREVFDKAGNEYLDSINLVFQEYNSWCNRRASLGKLFVEGTRGILPGDQSFVFEKNGARYGIVGLNSTWLQLDGGPAEGRLHVDVKQLLRVTSGDADAWCQQNLANLLVTHHPTNWLHQKSLELWRSELYPPGRFAAHLFGHMHEGTATSTSEGGSISRIAMQGISAFGLSTYENNTLRSHGYNVAMLKPSARRLKVWPRKLHKLQSGDDALGPDTTFKIGIDLSFALDLSPLFQSAREGDDEEENEPAVTLSEIPKDATTDAALQKTKHTLPAAKSHQNVRKVEQRTAHEVFAEKRAVWIVADWGMGADEFLSVLVKQISINNALTYRLDLTDFSNNQNLVDQINLTLECTFERYCQLLSNSDNFFSAAGQLSCWRGASL